MIKDYHIVGNEQKTDRDQDQVNDFTVGIFDSGLVKKKDNDELDYQGENQNNGLRGHEILLV